MGEAKKVRDEGLFQGENMHSSGFHFSDGI